ncbi:MAG: hypothetical protein JXB25_12840 [Deltaproteobacteria bacterium]|nr:hypothetical protein [Deltaproteobacteria bacterium]
MPKFKVVLRGENFFFSQDGELRKFGFCARRFVTAKNPEEAGKVALILVRQSPILKEARFEESWTRPVIRLEAVKKINPIAFLLQKSHRKIDFYPEDEG